MADRPILMSGPIVHALLKDRKTMTRRLAWRAPNYGNMRDLMRVDMQNRISTVWQRVRPGDRLWMRETFMSAIDAGGENFRYAADYDAAGVAGMRELQSWRPSIHMPRAASRLTLVVTETKIERLQEISEEDAKSEGAMFHDGRGLGHSGWRHDFKDVHVNARSSFARLWCELHGKGAWDANPEVVAVTFTVHQCNIDRMEIAA